MHRITAAADDCTIVKMYCTYCTILYYIMKLYSSLSRALPRRIAPRSDDQTQASISAAVLVNIFFMRLPRFQCGETPRHGVDT